MADANALARPLIRPLARSPAALPSGGIDHWLIERYCLYAADHRGSILRSDIHHAPWPIQPARAEIDAAAMTRWLGIDIASPPRLLHFARQLSVVAWSPERVS